VLVLGTSAAHADGDLNHVHHIIIMMQENHSFDNYFGVLGYVPASPYHNAKGRRGCAASDHTCVDGLSCKTPPHGGVLTCHNSNPSNLGGRVHAFHEPRYWTWTTAGSAATRRATSSGPTGCSAQVPTTASSR